MRECVNEKRKVNELLGDPIAIEWVNERKRIV
jgi:hypothetical protein